MPTIGDVQQQQIEKIFRGRILVQRIFTSEDGKELLDILKEICFYNRTTIFEAEPKWAEGRRSVVLDIEEMMKEDQGYERTGSTIKQSDIGRTGEYTSS
jgi:hypothetical protein